MNNYSKITPEGTRDLLFEECAARRRVERKLSTIFKSRGYRKVITPTVEFFDVFNRESSGMSHEMLYSLTDGYGRLIVLRADNTLPIARIAATRLRNEKHPLRLYYNQSVFRRCPSFSGRSDETTQCGIELIGVSGLRADIEILTAAFDSLASSGAPDFNIEIGHAGFCNALFSGLDADAETKAQIKELIEAKNYAALDDELNRLPQSLTVKALRALPRLFGGAEVLKRARELCPNDEAVKALDYLEKIIELMSEYGSNGGKISVDLGIVHRGSYYSGLVFRGFIEGSGMTVVSGGRYDGLIAEFGSSLPATGFGVDVSAIAAAMLARDEVLRETSAEVLVFGEDGFELEAVCLQKEIHSSGKSCELCVAKTLSQAESYARENGIGELKTVGKDGVKTVIIQQ